MSHYAKVINGKVSRVIIADEEFIINHADKTEGIWVETGVHTEEPLRGNHASIGHNYDEKHDVFYYASPFPSWVLDKTTWTWNAPIPHPKEKDSVYTWDESTLSWIASDIPNVKHTDSPQEK